MHDSESHLNNPEADIRSVFRKQILSFPSLLAASNFDKAVEDSFANLPLSFFNEFQTLRIQKPGAEEKWAPLFKSNYHKYIAGNLSNPDIESAILFSFAKLDDACRDYMTWYYENAFSPAQIVAITGQSLPFVRKNIWLCRTQLQEFFTGCNSSFSIAPADEERFQRLADYFDNTLPVSEAIKNTIWLENSEADTQRSDALELLLRQHKGIAEIRKKQDVNSGNTYLSADAFLQYAKEKIQQRNNNLP